MNQLLHGRSLYIADLARRQHEMESGRVSVQPLAYRVLSRLFGDGAAACRDQVDALICRWRRA